MNDKFISRFLFSHMVTGDLKPENILITESGHLKLTDFGGCRPVTQKTKELIQSIAQNALKDLRDGDWKAKTVKEHSTETMADDCIMEEMEEGNKNEEVEEEEDIRVEGTTAYLPPEVVLGAYPTTAADSWALGCVMFQVNTVAFRFESLLKKCFYQSNPYT
jgi:serine/threonine protein kinase